MEGCWVASLRQWIGGIDGILFTGSGCSSPVRSAHHLSNLLAALVALVQASLLSATW